MDFKENAKPIYMQIADRICDSTMAGEYQPGGRIPSVREYAAMVQVNANTVMRSYMHLSDKGIVFNKRGIGFFVSEDAVARIKELRSEVFFNSEVPYFFAQLHTMGISAMHLVKLYEDFVAKKQSDEISSQYQTN